MTDEIIPMTTDDPRAWSPKQLDKRIDEKTKPKGINVATLGEEIMADQHFFSRSERGPTWHFDKDIGIWSPKGREWIKKELKERLGRNWTVSKVSSVVQWIHNAAHDSSIGKIFGGYRNPHRVVLANGTYDLKTMTFYENEYYPEEYQAVKFAVFYDPKACCPAIMQFLEEILPRGDDRTCILQWTGYHLYGSYKYAKFLLLVGGGRNGKGTLLDILDAFMGEDNSSSLSMGDILYNKFKPAELYLKAGNLCGDISKGGLAKTSEIKKMTGGDSLTCERKNEQPFKFKNKAKITFAANEIPRTYDRTTAFYSRVRIIDFPNQFLKGNKKTKDKDTLTASLTTRTELSGLLNLALKAWKDVEKAKGVFDGDMSPSEVREDYELRTDPILTFSNFLIHTPGMRIPTRIPYDIYRHYCHFLGKGPTNDAWFSKRLRKIHGFIERGNLKYQGERAFGGFDIDLEGLEAHIRKVAEERGMEQAGGEGQVGRVNFDILCLSLKEKEGGEVRIIHDLHVREKEFRKAPKDDLFQTKVIGEEDTTE